MNDALAFDHAGVSVADLESSHRFYTDVLGFDRVELGFDRVEHAFELRGGRDRSRRGFRRFSTLGWRADRCRATLRRLRRVRLRA